VAQKPKFTDDWEKEQKKIKIVSIVLFVVLLIAAIMIALSVLRSHQTTDEQPNGSAHYPLVGIGIVSTAIADEDADAGKPCAMARKRACIEERLAEQLGLSAGEGAIPATSS
jgi:hypothetical protein